MLNITSIKIYPFDTSGTEGHIKAVAEITLNDTLIIRDIKIMGTKAGGFYLTFPSKKGPEDKFYELVQPKNQEAREWLRKIILAEFKKIEENST